LTVVSGRTPSTATSTAVCPRLFLTTEKVATRLSRTAPPARTGAESGEDAPAEASFAASGAEPAEEAPAEEPPFAASDAESGEESAAGGAGGAVAGRGADASTEDVVPGMESLWPPVRETTPRTRQTTKTRAANSGLLFFPEDERAEVIRNSHVPMADSEL
jgi:hypothetical protein